MIISSIKLRNFKNYAEQDVQFHPEVNVIVGSNGMGKTNLLDAVYYCAFCKSNFQKQDKNVTQHDKAFFRLEAKLIPISQVPMQLKIIVEASKSKKVTLNQKEYDKLSDHIGMIPMILITPGDIQTLLDGSDDRRRLMDTCISQIDKPYLQQLIGYNRLLKQRNAYLKSLDDPRYVDKELLISFDNQMEDKAKFIYEKRSKFVDHINPELQSIYKNLSSGVEEVSLGYRSQLEEGDYLIRCEQHRDKDLQLRRSTFGVHKDDLILQLNDKSLKVFGSQGQLKTYILALKIAQFNYLKKHGKESPVLILDDIFDKLDGQRVRNLISFLLENSLGQIFISDTSLTRSSDILEELNYQHLVIQIENGQVVQSK